MTPAGGGGSVHTGFTGGKKCLDRHRAAALSHSHLKSPQIVLSIERKAFLQLPSNPVTKTRSPGTAPGGGFRISTFCGVEAHKTMPCDSIPRIFCGFNGTWFTNPEMTVRGFSSPTSIVSTYKLSASGCFSALIIKPTRISKRLTSTTSVSFGTAGVFETLAGFSLFDRTADLASTTPL
uniref:Uncharacterized protein n=1 Tax=Romanomermis culicivorax TaxID=13658 RepID=A0A915HI40_ROMCU